MSGFQYKDAVLQFFPHAEGYVHYTKPLAVQGGQNSALGNFNYVFNYTDHLGNVRVSFAKDPVDHNVVKILEENHYYAFGLKHQNYNVDKLNFEEYPETGVEIVPGPAVANATYNYKYNSKELQEELGLNMYDYGFRNYDPALGRWMNIDPLAEKSRRWSTYTYCYNNPLVFVDYDGMFASPPTDFYNLYGDPVKSVPDGKTDKKFVLTLSKDEKVVDKKISKGEVVAVPSDEVIAKMDKAYSNTEKSGKENGFVVATDGTTSTIDEGKSGSVNLRSEYYELEDAGKTSSYDVHVHPNKTDSDGYVITVGQPMPSEENGDTDSYGKDGPNDSPSVVLGYEVKGTNRDQVITKQVGFYNAKSAVGKPIDYDDFKEAAKKVNNPKK